MKQVPFKSACVLIVLALIWAWIFSSAAAAAPAWSSATSQTQPDQAAGQAVEEIYVPAGIFPMGCSLDLSTAKCDTDAMPTRAIYVNAFYIDKLEVSNAQYAQCEAAGACQSPLYNSSLTRPNYHTNPAYANYPVLHIDWGRANAYCAWAGKRLATEAEWEKAARGDDMRWFAWGNDYSCERGNFRIGDNACVGDTTPVGNYPQGASPYGALDMTGNVHEWVSDRYARDYYHWSPFYNPQGATEGDRHLPRGGSWADDMSGVVTWIRMDDGIEDTYKIGIRCARSATTPPTPTDTPDVPTITPSPTSTSTPTPSAAGYVSSEENGMLWLAYPGHLTVVDIPSGVINPGGMARLRYEALSDNQGKLQGMNHFFSIQVDGNVNPSKTLSLTLAYVSSGAVIPGSVQLYRLDAQNWVTEGITHTHTLPTILFAQITRAGTYGLLGQTRRCYLPVLIRKS